MPTYEYECTRGCRFEIEQSIKDDALKRCPRSACPRGTGGVSVRRLISAASFILKGGGWYADGYGSKAPGKAKDGAGSDSGGGSNGKSADSASKSSDSAKTTSAGASKD
jgi:putative FmdB family regulatory protein